LSPFEFLKELLEKLFFNYLFVKPINRAEEFFNNEIDLSVYFIGTQASHYINMIRLCQSLRDCEEELSSFEYIISSAEEKIKQESDIELFTKIKAMRKLSLNLNSNDLFEISKRVENYVQKSKTSRLAHFHFSKN
jgi:hypothetical protein